MVEDTNINTSDKKRKKWLKIFLVIFCQILITILLLEGFLRWYFNRWNSNKSVPFLLLGRVYPDSQYLKDMITPSSTEGIVYEFKANIHTNFLDKPFNTNSKGILGTKEYSENKPENTLRIVGVGDSLMSSWGNNLDDTYLEVLRKNLNGKFSTYNIEAINLSVPGYNTAIEKSVIEKKALKYNPDLIVLGFCENDMDLPNFIRKPIRAKSYSYLMLKYLTDTVLSSFKSSEQNSIKRIEFLTDTPLSSDSIDDVDGLNQRFVWKAEEVPKEYEYMVGYDNYLARMKEISALSKDNNIPVIVVLNTWVVEEIPEINNLSLNILVIDKKLEKYLQDNKLSKKDIQISEDDHHLNSLGHSIYSQIIYDFIMSDTNLNSIFLRQ